MSNMLQTSEVEEKIASRIDNSITNALAVSRTAGGVTFANAKEVMEFSKLMALSRVGVRAHLRNNVGACMAITIQAIDWGLSPYAVASKSYSVNDQIAFESQLVQAVILKRAPIKGRIKFDFKGVGQDRVVRAWAKLREDDEIVELETPKLKDINPRNSPLWKSDPDQQQCYYAGRALCRRYFPDVLLGVYTDEEMETAEPLIGADQARDVTSAKTLTSRFDDIAGQANAGTKTAEADVDDVLYQEQGGEADAAGDGGTTMDAADRADEPDAHAVVIEKLRRAAMAGPQKLKFAFGKLTQAEVDLVTPDDRAALDKAAHAMAGAD